MGNGSLELQKYLKGSLHDFQESEYIKFCFCAFFVVSVELVKTLKINIYKGHKSLPQLYHIHLLY